MTWGARFEPIIRQGYEEETGRVVEDQGIHTFVNKKYDFIRYSADGLIVPLDARAPIIMAAPKWIFEAKSTGYITAKELEEDFPLDWQVQVQHGLFTLGLQKASLAVLVRGNQLRWKDIERNDAFIEQMLKTELEFWDMVKSGTPPDADYRESSSSSLAVI